MDLVTFCKTFHQVIKEESIPLSKHVVQTAIECYRKIFPVPPPLPTPINDTYLDFETTVNLKKAIIVNHYAFTASEIAEIFHSDLGSSTAELVPGYNACTLKMTFRQPHNPYTNKAFTMEELDSILAQLLFQGKVPIVVKFPEVAIFFLVRHQLDTHQEKYKITKDLSQLLEMYGLKFVQKYRYNTTTHQCDNASHWSLKDKIDPKDIILSLFETLA